MEYNLVSRTTALDTSEEVTRLLNAGWKLYGMPQVAAGPDGLRYVQALFKYDEEPEKPAKTKKSKETT